MTMPPKKQKLTHTLSQSLALLNDDDDDDFQNPSQFISLTQIPNPNPPSSKLLKPSNGVVRSRKKQISIGKENVGISLKNSISKASEKKTFCSISTADKSCFSNDVSCEEKEFESTSIESRLLYSFSTTNTSRVDNSCFEAATPSAVSAEKKGFDSTSSFESPLIESNFGCTDNVPYLSDPKSKMGFNGETCFLSNSIESRLLASRMNYSSSIHDNPLDDDDDDDYYNASDLEPGEQLNVLMKLCSSEAEDTVDDNENLNRTGILEGDFLVDGLVQCPLCGFDLSHLSEELQHAHTNDCLDKDEIQKVVPSSDGTRPVSPQRVVDVSPVLQWLQGLGLSKYEDAFVKEEIDWDTLQWLTEEDLISMGVTALGPRKKIVHSLKELRKGNNNADHRRRDASKISVDENRRLSGNKLITEFFPGPSSTDKNLRSVAGLESETTGSCYNNIAKVRNRDDLTSVAEHGLKRRNTGSDSKRHPARNRFRKGTIKDIPSWCCIPGTPFRVDAFRYLRGDCSHWFLTHFHMDHYQGLTRSFCHGKIYCSSITAQLVNMKIGIPWDKMQVLPINQKINIAGIDITCLDANHCPGSIIVLFEPPNGKAVLHTGDFRFSDEMANSSTLQSCAVHSLILDTTYCNPQYDFPKQEAVIQFVIEAIQAEAFNSKTLFLIGSYTIGKERLFLEVARRLHKKIYVGTAKLRLLECLELPEEDMKWFTSIEGESHIHVVPMWTIASFKRMKHISNQYMGRFNLIIAFSPSGWTFDKGRKKSQGRRLQQGTIIRYEVPYSEHCSFTELKEFVKLISPEKIIPSVNADSPESADAMTAHLMS